MVQVKKLKKKIFFNATGMHNTAGTTVYPDLAHLYGGLDIEIDPPYYPVTEWPSRRKERGAVCCYCAWKPAGRPKCPVWADRETWKKRPCCTNQPTNI